MSTYYTRTYRAQRRREEAAQWGRAFLAFTVILGVLAGFHTVIASGAGATGYPTVSPGYDSAQNHPSYWGDDCAKTERGLRGSSWSAPVSYRLVVLKSGTTNDVFTDVPADTQLSTVSGKDISHVIYCGPTPPPTTTTEVPPTTTTEAPPTTTVQPPTTTVPTPPSTTVTAPSTTTSVPEVPCEEDEPCWDCETMGNRTCGPIPVMPPPAPVVTTPRFTG